MSNYFHTDDPKTLAWLKNVVQRAESENLSLRLNVNPDNSLTVKLGGGMWSAPIESTFDLSRDTLPTHVGNFIMTVEDN